MVYIYKYDFFHSFTKITFDINCISKNMFLEYHREIDLIVNYVLRIK